jgi:transcriptional regulator with XRE-family HTH domain
MSKIVGEQIRASRLAVGLTQAEVARRLSVSPPYVANVEAGRTNLTLGQMTNIAAAMGVGLEIRFPSVERDLLTLSNR